MNIIVAGCGKIGTSVVSRLVLEGHDVVAVDKNPTVISEVTNVYDIMGVTGNAADCDTLTEAGAQSADMFVAMMDSDELNMLACLMAKRLGVQHTIA
ncbi:MAG: NAD-binding protein, partial [Oscillospiraceae bacterium]|nr:NAD-binding protein [Oscillospiraceae bacterium]